MPVTTVKKEGNVTTEIMDLTGGLGGNINAEEIMAKMGGGGGSYTETRADGTTVTYELDVEEFEVRENALL